MEFIIESDVIIRSVDKPFNSRQIIGSFPTSELAYNFIEKYINDTKELHTHFSRHYVCPKDECEKRINDGRLVAINIVLGQFEDIIYIRKTNS